MKGSCSLTDVLKCSEFLKSKVKAPESRSAIVLPHGYLLGAVAHEVREYAAGVIDLVNGG